MLNRLKYILLMLVLFTASQSEAQYVIDRVCQGASRNYKVEGELNSTYKWSITDPFGKVTLLPDTTASILNYKWTQDPGTYFMTVVQYSAAGCDSVQKGEIQIVNPPFASAGNNALICSGSTFLFLQDTAAYYSALRWTTSGDGKFSNDTLLHPIYTPGLADITTGYMTLTLTADGLGRDGTCAPAVSSMVLTISKSILSEVSVTECNSYTWVSGDGKTYTNSGIYDFLSVNSDGCYDTLRLRLTINNGILTTISRTACGAYTFNGITYTTSGIYDSISTNANSCSDTLKLKLTINNGLLTTISRTACGTYTFNRIIYTTSGVYDSTSTNAGGCADTLRLKLTINNGLLTTISRTACGAYTFNGITYTTSGVYDSISTNAGGCTDTLRLKLKINNGLLTTISRTACGSYVFNGITYTTSGVYDSTSTNAAGCTDTLRLKLTINNGLLTTISRTACVAYIFNGITYTTSGVYDSTSTNANGCIDTLRLKLTISKGSLTKVTEIACSNYTWVAGNGITYNASGIYDYIQVSLTGCTDTLRLFLTINKGSITADKKDAGCFGSNNGSIDLHVSDETKPYTYIWSNGSASQDVSALKAGSYSVVVTDFIGCIDTLNFTILQAPQIKITATKIDAGCIGGSNKGEINLTVSGGTPAYMYQWSNGSTSEDIQDLASGSYDVKVTDAMGCTADSLFIIEEAAAISIAEIKIDAGCFGSATGSVVIKTSGGIEPVTYLWSTGETTNQLSGLKAGKYTVKVTDANGCFTSHIVIINESPQIKLTAKHTNAGCYGENKGRIDLTVTGGEAPYTYEWNIGAITQDIDALAAGIYKVLVTDNIGCTGTLVDTITDASYIDITEIHQSVQCLGSATAGIILTVKGGTAPYTYIWSNGATSQNLTNIKAGKYSVTVTDKLGCSNMLNITVEDADAIVIQAKTTDALCKGSATGSIDLDVIGGRPPYAFSWSNGETTENISSLKAGTYTVNIVDAVGCIASLKVKVGESPGILIAETIANISCFGDSTGKIKLVVSGGQAPYTYLWSTGSTADSVFALPAGLYSVMITDATGCPQSKDIAVSQNASIKIDPVITDASCYGLNNGSINLLVNGGKAPYSYLWTTGETTSKISDLGVGIYNVKVTDGVGCSGSVRIIVNEPEQLNLSATHVNTGCKGSSRGSIDLTVTGGSGKYTYIWNNGATTQDIHNLEAGPYSVVVTDRNGCTSTKSVTIEEFTTLAVDETHTDVSCFGSTNGTIHLIITGEVAPVTYAWSNGATTNDLTDLAPGKYTVTVTDANHCKVKLDIAILEPDQLALSKKLKGASCNGGTDGEIDITVEGGNAPYTFLWSNGKNTEDITGLRVNEYFVKVTDSKGCFLLKDFNVPEVSGVDIAVVHANATCKGNDGSIDLTINAGKPPYSILWSNGATTEDISNLVPGTYTVRVTDQSTCFTEVSINIGKAPDITLTETHTNASCNGVANGSIDLTVKEGTQPYDFKWSNGSVTEDVSNLAAGTYKVRVTDQKGCFADLTIIIDNDPGFTLAEKHTDASCSGIANGSIDLTVVGGTAPFTFVWSNGAVTEDLTNLPSGNYLVTVTDAKGCKENLTISINNGVNLSLAITLENVSCSGGNTGNAGVTVSGGTAPYTYLWSNGVSSNKITDLIAGIYTVKVTDANGCNASASVTITQPTPLAVSVSFTNATCSVDNGKITVKASGGVGNYSYSINNGITWITDSVFTKLGAGKYEVRVKDRNNCEVVYASNPVVLNNVPGPKITKLDIQNAVEGGKLGSVVITAQADVKPLLYSVDGITWQSDSIISDLTANVYTAYVKDVNGCIDTKPFEVKRIVLGRIQLTSSSLESCMSVSIDVPIYATSGFTNITAFHIELNFDPKVLELLKINDINTNLSGGRLVWDQPKPGTLAINYTAADGTVVSIPSDNLLLALQFNSIAGGDAKLNWNELNCTFTALGAYTVPTIYTIGKINILPLPKFNAAGAGVRCENDSVTLTARSFDPDLSYEWIGPNKTGYLGDIWPLGKLSKQQSGQYVLIGRSKALCESRDTLDLLVNRRPVINFGFDTLCLYEPVLLDPGSGDGIYTWNFNQQLISYSPTVTAEKEGMYHVQVTNRYDCTVSDSIYLMKCEINWLIPNAFSPNGDGLNDTFRPLISGAEPLSYVLNIYNKWGQLLFTTTNFKTGWDGRVNGVMSPPGVYVYSIDYFVGPTIHSNKSNPIHGTVTLVR